jgi:hypothetical protein
MWHRSTPSNYSFIDMQNKSSVPQLVRKACLCARHMPALGASPHLSHPPTHTLTVSTHHHPLNHRQERGRALLTVPPYHHGRGILLQAMHTLPMRLGTQTSCNIPAKEHSKQQQQHHLQRWFCMGAPDATSAQDWQTMARACTDCQALWALTGAP